MTASTMTATSSELSTYHHINTIERDFNELYITLTNADSIVLPLLKLTPIGP